MLERFIGLALTLGLILMAATWWSAGEADEATLAPEAPGEADGGVREPRDGDKRDDEKGEDEERDEDDPPDEGLISSLLGGGDDDDGNLDEKKRGKGRD